MLKSLAAMALAVLASRSNPQAAQAVLIGSQAALIQSQLNFTRDHEKEADRIGLNILVSAGLDPHGMTEFFERLQKASRFHENGAPSYLRTHPITHERIADIENRTQAMSYRQVPDSLDFQLVRAKLRALTDKPLDAVKFFDSTLREKRYSKEAVERYGLIHALLRARDYTRADSELPNLYRSLESNGTDKTLMENHRLGKAIRIERKISESNAMIETLAARVKLAAGDKAEAFDIYKEALKTFPQHRALSYDYAESLLDHESAEAAIKFINQQLQFTPNDIRLYKLQAQSYEALGNLTAQHRALAEVYSRQGNYSAAIEQLQIALRNSNADFYEASSAEARLRELRDLAAEHGSKSKQ